MSCADSLAQRIDQTEPIPLDGKLLVGTKILPSAGVAVWTE